MLIVPGPASRELAHSVSILTGIPTAEVESKIFPDGDSYLRVKDSVRGEDVVIIQSTYPPQDRNLIQLFLMIDGLRDLGCRKAYAIVPYLAYSRQDKRFLEGELVSAKSILNLIKCLSIDKIITIDIHNRDILVPLGLTAQDTSATPLLGRWIESHRWKAPLIIAPDKGASQRARVISEALATDYKVGTKTRDRYTGEVTLEFDAGLNVAGRVAVIVDDTIARGDTVVKAGEILLQRGAERVAALCTHGLFLDEAVKRIESVGIRDIVSTDTIPSSQSKISVAPLIGDILRPLAAQKAHS